MKNKLLIIILFISTSFFSQKKFGAYVGINKYSLSDGNFESFNFINEPSYHLGILYEWKLSSKIKVRPKLTFSQQGNRKVLNAENYNFKTDYLNIHLNFKFFEKTYLLAGPQIGILLNQKNLALREYNNLDFGINLGIGQRINNFFLELNYYQGVTPFVERIRIGNNIVKGYNTLFQLSLGYYLF
jgi:hypothetical protein